MAINIKKYIIKILLITLLMLTIVQCVSSNTNDFIDKKIEYSYDTTNLIGGSFIYYKTIENQKIDSNTLKINNEVLECLCFENDNIYIELSCISKGHPIHNIGYLEADYKDYFVIKMGFGSGSLIIFDLIEKKTGNSIVNHHLVDINQKEGMIIYKKFGFDDLLDEFYILDIENLKHYSIPIPKDLNEDCFYDGYLCFNFHKIDQDKFILEYYSNNDEYKFINIKR